MFKYTFAVIGLLFLATSPASSQVTPIDAEATRGYLLGPGDEITTKVLGEEQFDFVATIDQDGRIEVPFVDKPIDANCKSERELRADITELLRKYLKNPQASVRVTKRNSRLTLRAVPIS
jgi:protein involved in polysaccharide export with SLBB domain